MIFLTDSALGIRHVPVLASSGLGIGAVILAILLVILICGGFLFVFISLMLLWQRRVEVRQGNAEIISTLTPTQRFILAASSPTVCNNYKCVIDIWDTRTTPGGAERAVELFEWGWGACTCENARNMVDECLKNGYHVKYPGQGMLAWDLVRVLSIVGGAYMGGAMEYGEAAGIALETCRLLQANFSSWDDMVESYTLGYQRWRGRKKKDRLRYYKRLKRGSQIYSISWNTELKEEEL